MNVKELNEKYQRIQNWQDEYRKELISYINEAFAMHGNEFEYKCDTHDSWVEKNEDEDAEFNAMNEFPAYLMIGMDDGTHEVHIYHIRQTCTDWGYKSIEVDGWDWDSGCWVHDLTAYSAIDDLQSIANFINAVLDQEAEAK